MSPKHQHRKRPLIHLSNLLFDQTDENPLFSVNKRDSSHLKAITLTTLLLTAGTYSAAEEVKSLENADNQSEEALEPNEGTSENNDGAAQEQATSSSEVREDIETIQVIGNKDFGVELSSKKILKVPGAGGDPLKAVEALPGVTLAQGRGGSRPAVRGSSPNDNLYETDYVPVGYVFHNDGNSTYNGNLIQSFELKTGAWEPEYADAIGSVIDTKLRDPKMDNFETTLDFSFLRAGALIEGPITENQAFYASIRESLVHLYVDALIDEEQLSFSELPRNYDYQAKYLWQINENDSLRLVATGANDRVEILFPEGSDTLDQQPELQGGVGVFQYYDNQGLIWQSFNALGEVTVAFNHLEQNADLKIGRIIDLDATSNDYSMRTRVVTDLNNGVLSYGLDLRQQQADYVAIGKDQPCNREFESCPPSYFSDEIIDEGLLTINFANVFSDYQWYATDTITLRPGIAISTNDFTEEQLVEPRLSLKWEFIDDYAFKAAVGQHHQWFRQYRYIADEFGSPDLAMQKADHYGIAFQFEGSSEWAWKVETYYKKLYDLIVSNPLAQVVSNDGVKDQNQSNYLNAGEGEAFGLEILINKNFSDNWYGWLSVAYSETTRNNTITGDEFRFAYDQPWIVNLVANYEWGDNWEFGIKWRYQSGQLFTPVEGAIPVYPRDAVTGIPDTTADVYFYDALEGEINSERFPGYHRMDVRADRRWELDSMSIDLYFEVLNLYGQQNVSGYSYNRDYSEREKVYAFPEMPLPSIGVKATF